MQNSIIIARVFPLMRTSCYSVLKGKCFWLDVDGKLERIPEPSWGRQRKIIAVIPEWI